GIRDRTVTGVQTCALPISEEGGIRFADRLSMVTRMPPSSAAQPRKKRANGPKRSRRTKRRDRSTRKTPRFGRGSAAFAARRTPRSEERRVGKEGGGRGWAG